MKSFFHKIYSREHFALLFIGLIWIGLVTDRAVMSIGMISLTISALLETRIWKNSYSYVRLVFFPLEGFIINTFKNYKVYRIWFLRFFSAKETWYLALFMVPVIISGLWSSDKMSYWNVLVIKSPFLFLPFAIGSLKMVKREYFIALIYLFIAIILVSSLGVFANYVMHFDSINHNLLAGQPIPVPYKEHIRYSLLIVLSIYILFVFIIWQVRLKYKKWESVLCGVILVWLIIFLHILSVRSGLFAMYFSLIPLTFSMYLKNKNLRIFLVVLIAAFLVAALSLLFIPSTKNRIAYMKWELEHAFNDQSIQGSDAGRILSIQAGWKYFKEHPLGGSGAGDLKSEMLIVYANDFPGVNPSNRQMPHNQFLYSAVQTGILGIISVLVGLLFPFILVKGWKLPILSGFLFISGSALLWEHMLETQMGIAFFLVWYLILLKWEPLLYKDMV